MRISFVSITISMIFMTILLLSYSFQKTFIIKSHFQRLNMITNIDENMESWLNKIIFMFWKKKPVLEEKQMKTNNGIIVFGSTGKTGYEIIKKLLDKSSKEIIMVAKNDTKLYDLYGTNEIKNERIFLKSNLDITNVTLISEDLFKNVEQVIISTGIVISLIVYYF